MPEKKFTVLEVFLDKAHEFASAVNDKKIAGKTVSEERIDAFFDSINGARLIVHAQTIRKGQAIELLEEALADKDKRIQELLEANTAYLTRARSAEDRLEGFRCFWRR